MFCTINKNHLQSLRWRFCCRYIPHTCMFVSAPVGFADSCNVYKWVGWLVNIVHRLHRQHPVPFIWKNSIVVCTFAQFYRILPNFSELFSVTLTFRDTSVSTGDSLKPWVLVQASEDCTSMKLYEVHCTLLHLIITLSVSPSLLARNQKVAECWNTAKRLNLSQLTQGSASK